MIGALRSQLAEPNVMTRPVPLVCTACRNGHHEQRLLGESCDCPCHGTASERTLVYKVAA